MWNQEADGGGYRDRYTDRYGGPEASGGRRDREPDIKETPTPVLWLGGLRVPPLTESFMRELFAGFPGLVNVACFEDKKIAYIHFRTTAHASVARAALMERPLSGVKVKVAFAREPQSAHQMRTVGGYSVQDRPSAYHFAPTITRPVDYYDRCGEGEEFLAENEVEELLGHLRELHPSNIRGMQAMADWIVRFGDKIKDIVTVIETRVQDVYMGDPGKRLQIFYLVAYLLKTTLEDSEEVYRHLSVRGVLSELCRHLCWNQPPQACSFVDAVLTHLQSNGFVDDDTALELLQFVKTKVQVEHARQNLAKAAAGDLPGPPGLGGLGPPPGMPGFPAPPGMPGGLSLQQLQQLNQRFPPPPGPPPAPAPMQLMAPPGESGGGGGDRQRSYTRSASDSSRSRSGGRRRRKRDKRDRRDRDRSRSRDRDRRRRRH
eukprot:Hpha_TRINITY_DN12075_c0_g2::TRINITY_DN12075_c0_g2_i1::g.141265::m.141265